MRPVRNTPDPVDAAFVATRITALTHELANLLDGSMRLLGKARRTLQDGKETTLTGAGHLSLVKDGSVSQLGRHLETVYAAMLQMSDLVRLSMAGVCVGGVAGLRAGLSSNGSLADAIRHAVEVMLPVAEEHGIELKADLGHGLDEVRAGPVYGVITNGIRNAVESIVRSEREHGHVLVSARVQTGRTGAGVVIEILDDGQGPPDMPSPADGADSVFRFGFTTKPGGVGAGLAISRELVQQLGGTIALKSREKEMGRGQTGAVLRVCYPVPPVSQERAV